MFCRAPIVGRVISSTIARELGVPENHVQAAIDLLDEGNTVPFIARYRKEKTGGLDDSQLRELDQRLSYLRELEDRKNTILAAIDEQGKLTDDLKALIVGCETKARLEDLYLPYKKRRKTKADTAREAGLEPLADLLIERGGSATFTAETAAGEAEAFICEGFAEPKAVVDGARAIIIDRLATDADLVGGLRDDFFAKGSLTSSVVEGKQQEGQRFSDYFDYSEPFTSMPSHRILAVLRGESEGVLTVTLSGGDDEMFVSGIANHTGWTMEPGSWLRDAATRGWRTKLGVSAGLDARMKLKDVAEDEALKVFATNLRDVLLAAPAGQRATLGIDPGYRNGCKCAVIGKTGTVLDTVIVYPHQPQNRFDDAVKVLSSLAATHRVELIAVGNGTASRESVQLAGKVADLLAAAGGEKPVVVTVSESGASVYSASKLAAEEFPDMDVSLRGAVSIARRLQDPLAELVKIDPKSIGVGQYQHDVNQTNLATTLDAVVEDAVNAVGVDLNTASAALLGRVAGISATLAGNIVAHRDSNGAFTSRKGLLDVQRLGPKAFEQCAGFLRINGGDNPLDRSAVHPEAYPVVEKIVAATGLTIDRLIGNSPVLAKLKPEDFADDTFGVPTVTDIIAELDKPGRDPRPEFVTATFKEGVEKISDLHPGMILEGTVTNVAAFGAFVDVGVHQDGLVHISAMKKGFVDDPHSVVKSGDIVKVKVMDVDVDRKRISLSLRLDDDPEETGSGKPRGNRDKQSTSGRRGNRGNSGEPRGNQRGSKTRAPKGSMADALRQAGFGK
nr:Tex family protein [Corynebacterium mendelii]